MNDLFDELELFSDSQMVKSTSFFPITLFFDTGQAIDEMLNQYANEVCGCGILLVESARES